MPVLITQTGNWGVDKGEAGVEPARSALVNSEKGIPRMASPALTTRHLPEQNVFDFCLSSPPFLKG